MIRHTKDQYSRNTLRSLNEAGPFQKEITPRDQIVPVPAKDPDAETEQSEDCDPNPCGCDGVTVPCEGQTDTMGNEYVCNEACQLLNSPCCWAHPSLGIYDPATGRYWVIIEGEWVYMVYECTSMGPNDEQTCEWVHYDAKGNMVYWDNGRWGKRTIQPNFNPWYYYEIDTDGDGVNDMACGFFYNWATGGYHFGCQIIF